VPRRARRAAAGACLVDSPAARAWLVAEVERAARGAVPSSDEETAGTLPSAELVEVDPGTRTADERTKRAIAARAFRQKLKARAARSAADETKARTTPKR
jgi:hypothetical protein